MWKASKVCTSPAVFLSIVTLACAAEEPFHPRTIDFVPPAREWDPRLADDAGRVPLISQGPVTLAYVHVDADPLAALKSCYHYLNSCFAGGKGGRRIDDCVHSVPACEDARPEQRAGECCPDSCRRAYETRRRAGADPLRAMIDTSNSSDCFGTGSP